MHATQAVGDEGLERGASTTCSKGTHRPELTPAAVGPSQAAVVGCLQASNPLGREEYEEVVARWVGALLVLADHVAARPRGDAASRQAQQIQQPLPPTPPFKQDLARSDCLLACAAHRMLQHAGLVLWPVQQVVRACWVEGTRCW